MELAEILNELQGRGLRAVIRNGVLFVGPGDRMNDELREAVKDNMADLLAHFAAGNDHEVSWRITAMLAQLLPLFWPCAIPILFALPNCEPNKEDCKSCGELRAIGEGDTLICGPCARAKDLGLSIWMQRPAQIKRAA